MIAEEVVAYEYEQEDGTTSMALDNELTSDVEAQEDSWAGGQNIHNQVDHVIAGGSEESSVRGVGNARSPNHLRDTTGHVKKRRRSPTRLRRSVLRTLLRLFPP